jgi:dTMP kinase
MPRGFFITFEGLDGSGKTTQLRRLKEWLEAKDLAVTPTRQPGGTRLGDRIRTLVLDSRNDGIAAMAELGLMFTDRAQAIAEVIQPALDAGRVVVCDRFTDSSEAYQGGGRGLGSQVVRDLHAALCGGLEPDVTLMLLADFDMSLRRARQRNQRVKTATGSDENRFEKEASDFYRRVFDKYQEIARRESERVVAIDSDESIEEIHQRIVEVIEPRLRAAGILQGS